jgi:hypothetical protein
VNQSSSVEFTAAWPLWAPVFGPVGLLVVALFASIVFSVTVFLFFI